MRNIRMILFCILFLLTVFSQASHAPQVAAAPARDMVEIIPGVGIGELKLGLSYEEVEPILGKPEKVITFGQSHNEYLRSGYDPSKLLVFHNDFDYEMTYNSEETASHYPVYMLYFKQDRLCHIVLSIYRYDSKLDPFLIDDRLGFHCSKTEMEEVLGTNYFYYKRKVHSDKFCYLDKGITVILDSDYVSFMSIYEPLDRDSKEAFLQNRKQAKLREFVPDQPLKRGLQL